MAAEKPEFEWDDHFFGAVTVGERGQVVIPADARKRFDISPGDKLLIMSDPGKKSLDAVQNRQPQNVYAKFSRRTGAG